MTYPEVESGEDWLVERFGALMMEPQVGGEVVGSAVADAGQESAYLLQAVLEDPGVDVPVSELVGFATPVGGLVRDVLEG